MDVFFEQRIVQSPVLAAEAIWTAAVAFLQARDGLEGMPLGAAFLVLPIVFHRPSAEALSTKNLQGALHRALAENREMPVLLQARVESMADNTWRAVNIALAADLIRLDQRPPFQLLPRRRTLPFQHSTEAIRTIAAASKRLGHALAQLTLPSACALLGVRF